MIGSSVSHYRITAKLGEGGMGVVYKAEDTKLGRTVALKFLASHALDDAEAKERFLREARAAASLDHPNVCTVYEIAEADGQTFLSLAFIEGQTVKDRIAQRPLPLAEALDIALQAGEGLAAAHEKGIVHRDIKSANLMVTPDGKVKVTDFGLAQLAGQSWLTKSRTTLGTAAYMSPEQAQRQPVDRRTDIWSLGVVIYEMVTGRLPFGGDHEAAVLYSIVHSTPEPITGLRVGLPPALDRVVSKALAKKPDDRYQHMADLLVDLRALQKGLPVSAPVRFSRRKAILAAGGVAAAAVAAVVGLRRDRSGPRFSSLAVLPLENLTGDPKQEYFADGMTDALITNLSKAGALKVISRTTAMRYKQTDKPLPEIARELNVDAVVAGSVAREAGVVRVTAQLINATTDEHLWAESYERDLTSILALQSEVARAIAARIQVTLSPAKEARPVNPETYEAYLRGMFWLNKSTPEGIQKGMAYFHEAVEKDPGDPLAYAGLALGYLTLAHGPTPPEDALPRAKAAALRAVRLDETLAEAQTALAFLQGYYDWQWELSRRTLDHALAINPSLAIARYHSSWMHILFDRAEEAIAEHKRAQELDPLMPDHTADLGVLYAWLGRYDEALAEGEKAVDIAPNYPRGYQAVGLAHRDVGEFDQAIAAHQKMGEISALWKWEVGCTYAAAGQTSEAQQVLAQLKRQDVTPWHAFWLAKLHTALGDKDEAFRWLNYERPHAWAPWIRVWPDFQPLHDDPRFAELMKRMNLPMPV